MELNINLGGETITFEDIEQALQENGGSLTLNPMSQTSITPQEIKDKLLQNLNTNILTNAQLDKLNRINFDVYSLNEVQTNKIWINGKKIYRKCIDAITPSTNVKQFYFVSDDIEQLTDFYVLIKRDNDKYEKIMSFSSSSGSSYVFSNYSIDEKSIVIKSYHYSWSQVPFFAVIEYTKVDDV